MQQRLDLGFYFQALPIYARNLGVLLPPLIAAAIGLGLEYLEGPLFSPIGGAGDPLIGFIIQIIIGFAFAVSVIFADDAWRQGRGSLGNAWYKARRRVGEIIISVIGFFFLIYVAQLIGGIIGSILHLPFIGLALGALAVWAFIYAIPAAAIGGVPSGAAFSASLQAAKRHPLPTAILTIVSLLIYYYVGLVLPTEIGPYLGAGYVVGRVLLQAIALGYIALVVTRQYSDFAFRFW
jgi:hypothetical protein